MSDTEILEAMELKKITVALSSKHYKYLLRQAEQDERTIDKVIESALGCFQLYREGKLVWSPEEKRHMCDFGN